MKEIELVITLDMMLVKRKMTLTELSERTGIQLNNLSVFKNGKGAVVKLSSLLRLCAVLDCTPNDIINVREKEEREPTPIVWEFSGLAGKPDQPIQTDTDV